MCALRVLNAVELIFLSFVSEQQRVWSQVHVPSQAGVQQGCSILVQSVVAIYRDLRRDCATLVYVPLPG